MLTYLIRINRNIRMMKWVVLIKSYLIHPCRLNAFLWVETLICRVRHRKFLISRRVTARKSGFQVRRILDSWPSRFCINLITGMSHFRQEKCKICRLILHISIDVGSDRKVRWNMTTLKTIFHQNKANKDILHSHREKFRHPKDHCSRMAQTVLGNWENR